MQKDYYLAPIAASIFFMDCLGRLLHAIHKKILRKAGIAFIENAKTVASNFLQIYTNWSNDWRFLEYFISNFRMALIHDVVQK
jgi:hypothetical protein